MRTPAVDAHFLECTTILNGQKKKIVSQVEFLHLKKKRKTDLKMSFLNF